MTLADSAGLALAVTAVLAVAARLAGALTTGGAVAGALVGACVSVGFGLPGLAVLGTFFVVGTLATRIGWEKKKARGTAEAGEGRRDWKRVLGKGGVAAAAALVSLLVYDGAHSGPRTTIALLAALAFPGVVAAALADTLGTEIGTLFPGEPRSVPSFRRVAIGTPGAVSVAGVIAAAFGAFLVSVVWVFAVESPETLDSFLLHADHICWITTAGLAASLIESLAVGLGLRTTGFRRNVLTTLAGAVLVVAIELAATALRVPR
jgi:uncharacterized protein (TIGR00297 family)